VSPEPWDILLRRNECAKPPQSVADRLRLKFNNWQLAHTAEESRSGEASSASLLNENGQGVL